jgi:hypothetical protein
MNHKRVIATTTTLGLVLILAWGCQNSKPVGPMKYVTLNATISTSGIAKTSGFAVSGMELLYRVTGPSMNPVSGKVTVGAMTSVLANPSAAPVDYVEPLPSIANFTIEVPAGPSRTLAVQLNAIDGPQFSLEGNMADPIRVLSIGATRFDIDPGTPVVDVPVEVGPMCWGYGIDEDCFATQAAVAYMGNTDLVNCAFVPDEDAFFGDTCDAKRYFYGDSGPVDAISSAAMNTPYPEVGDVYCFSFENGHEWAQVAGTSGDMIWKFRDNHTLPYYAFDPDSYCGLE